LFLFQLSGSSFSPDDKQVYFQITQEPVMKKSALALTIGLSLLFNSAYGDTYDATRAGGGYVFSNTFAGDTNFNDYISFSTDGLQQILASISGTGTTMNFQEFNLLDTNKNWLMTGTVFNTDDQISFGFAKSVQQGNYYLQIIGQSTGTNAGYAGTISLANAVPEPETAALLLAGLGLVALRRKTLV
jgi:hypothetical protein